MSVKGQAFKVYFNIFQGIFQSMAIFHPCFITAV